MDITFSTTVALIPVIIGLSIVILGIFLAYKVAKSLGALIGLAGIFFLIVFGPILLMDKVEIDDNEIIQHTGFWFSQTTKGFSLKNIDHIVITEENHKKYGIYEIWIAVYQSGDSIKVDPGDLWESNSDKIIKYLEQINIQVINEN